MKKKSARMTLKEFFDSAKDEETRQFVLATLKSEGFTEKQINEMKMENVWKLVLDSCSTTMERVERDMDSFAIFLKYVISALVESKPELTPAFKQALKDVSEMMEELTRSLERLNKELEEELKEREKRRKKE